MTEMILNSVPPPGSAVSSISSHRSMCLPGARSVRIDVPLPRQRVRSGTNIRPHGERLVE